MPTKQPAQHRKNLLTAHCSPPSAAPVLAIILRFLSSSLADFSFCLERNELARILCYLETVGAVIGATITTTGRDRRTGDPQS